MDRKVVYYRSLNETCSFYFEPLIGSGRPGYALMEKERMNYLFNCFLKNDGLSTQNSNKISKWKEEHGY